MSVSPHDHSESNYSTSFEALFRTYHSALCTFAYRYVLARDVAEELVQEVFLYVWEHELVWDDPSAAKSYLFTAVRNASLSYLRHQGVTKRLEGDVISLLTSRPSTTPDRDLRLRELGQALAARGDAFARPASTRLYAEP